MATTNGPIGVAVIGCGSISHPHLDGWQRLVRAGEARLEVACDNELERAEAQAGRYGAAAAATDFAEVVRRPEVQAVDICLPHHLHLPAILAAAEAGVHVLCEKPLVLNMDEAVTAIRACRDAGVKLMTADRDRFEPPARAVKRILDAGLIGDIYHVLERHMLHKDVITQGSRSNMGWKLGKATAGAARVHRDGCYYIDTLLFWEGSGVKHIAGAEFDNFLWETAEIETTSHVLFRFNSGAIGVFEMVWCLQGPQHREVFVTGSEGYVKLTAALGMAPMRRSRSTATSCRGWRLTMRRLLKPLPIAPSNSRAATIRKWPMKSSCCTCRTREASPPRRRSSWQPSARTANRSPTVSTARGRWRWWKAHISRRKSGG